MKESEMYQNIYKNAEMGRDNLSHLRQANSDLAFDEVLKTQEQSYQNVMDHAAQKLSAMGERPRGANNMAKMGSHMSSRMHTMFNNAPSKMADMVIQGAAMGVSEIQKCINQYDGQDAAARDLANDLLKKEQGEIEQMKQYL